MPLGQGATHYETAVRHDRAACPHPFSSWRRPDGGCYVCWCEREITRLGLFRVGEATAGEQVVTHLQESKRACAECGIPVRPGDGGVRAFGRLFCSELCADCQDPAFNDGFGWDYWGDQSLGTAEMAA